MFSRHGLLHLLVVLREQIVGYRTDYTVTYLAHPQ